LDYAGNSGAPRKCDNCVANTQIHRAWHEHFRKHEEEPDDAHSSLSETMAARIEIKELGDPARECEITDAIVALDGVIEARIQKGALHVSYDPLTTTEKKIEQAVRSTGNTVKAAPQIQRLRIQTCQLRRMWSKLLSKTRTTTSTPDS
jgi:copper chaperone CopZ